MGLTNQNYTATISSEMDWTAISIAFIGIVPPTLAVVVSAKRSDKKRTQDKNEMISIAEKNASKASIQNMITQDIIRTELLGRLPENKDNIEAEYDNYHKNGGNGTITRQVAEYNNWYSKKEMCFRCKDIIDEETGRKVKICGVDDANK